MNRKGDLGEGVHWIFRIMLAAILALLLGVQIGLLTQQRAMPIRMELALYEQRLVSGPDGISHEEHGRPIPGTVDLAKFVAPDRLDGRYVRADGRFGAVLRLYARFEDIENRAAAYVATHNKEAVDSTLPLAKAGLTGPGGGYYQRTVRPVILVEGDSRELYWLEFEAVMRS